MYVVKLPKSGKQKSNFGIGLIIIKGNIEHLKSIIGKFFKILPTLTIV